MYFSVRTHVYILYVTFNYRLKEGVEKGLFNALQLQTANVPLKEMWENVPGKTVPDFKMFCFCLQAVD